MAVYTLTLNVNPKDANLTFQLVGDYEINAGDAAYDPEDIVDGGDSQSNPTDTLDGNFLYHVKDNVITATEGVTIAWSASKEHYISQSGTVTLIQNTVLNIDLILEKHTFAIVATPADATISLVTQDGTQVGNSIQAFYGYAISYKVSKLGYQTRSGSVSVTKDTEFTINLIPEIVEKDYQPIIEELKNYYANLLIIQYHNKPKAIAMIKKTIEIAMSDLIIMKIRDGFNIDTAIGKQLDIIGEWVGLYSRVYDKGQPPYPWFSLIDWTQSTTAPYQGGFQDWDDPSITTGGFIGYDDIIIGKNTTKLNDNMFRFLIKLKIVKNCSKHTMKDLDDRLWDLFGSSLYITWGYSSTQLSDTEPAGMSLTYNYTNEYAAMIELAKQQGNIIPIPTGMLVYYNEL